MGTSLDKAWSQFCQFHGNDASVTCTSSSVSNPNQPNGNADSTSTTAIVTRVPSDLPSSDVSHTLESKSTISLGNKSITSSPTSTQTASVTVNVTYLNSLLTSQTTLSSLVPPNPSATLSLISSAKSQSLPMLTTMLICFTFLLLL
jgi:hypothetical protein